MFSIDKAARDQREPGSLLARLRGAKMRDPGNEVAINLGMAKYIDNSTINNQHSTFYVL